MTLRSVSRFAVVLLVLMAIAATATLALANHKRPTAIEYSLTATPAVVPPAPTSNVEVSLYVTVSSDGIAPKKSTDTNATESHKNRMHLRVYYVDADGNWDGKRGRKAWKLHNDSDDEFPDPHTASMGSTTQVYPFTVHPTRKCEPGATYVFEMTAHIDGQPEAKVSTNVTTSDN